MPAGPQALPLLCAALLVGGFGASLALTPKAFYDMPARRRIRVAPVWCLRLAGSCVAAMGAVAIWRAFNLSDVVLGLGGAVMVAVGMPYAFRARLIAKFFGRTGEVGYDGPVLRLVGSIYLVFGCVLLAAAGMFVHL